MLDTVKINHVQHISFTQSRLTDAVSVILSELLSYEHPPKPGDVFLLSAAGFLYIFTELAQNRRLPLSFAALRCIITSFGRTFLPANK